MYTKLSPGIEDGPVVQLYQFNLLILVMITIYRTVQHPHSVEGGQFSGQKSQWEDVLPEERETFIRDLVREGSKVFLEISVHVAIDLGILNPQRPWHRMFLYAESRGVFDGPQSDEPYVEIRAPEDGSSDGVPRMYISIALSGEPTLKVPVSGVDIGEVTERLMQLFPFDESGSE